MGNIKVVGRRALIGSTGFVGGRLDAPGRFTDRYHRPNVDTMYEHYHLIVCAAAPGRKWLANLDPNADATSIAHLCKALVNVTADRFVLISTIDAERKHPYAVHRKALEQFVLKRFPGAAIMRLPALFGKGLKKNALFELLSGRGIGVPRRAQYHWYNMGNLWYDSQRAAPGINTYYSAPVTMGRIMDEFFPEVPLRDEEVLPEYTYNEPPPYTHSEEEIMEELRRFIASWRLEHALSKS